MPLFRSKYPQPRYAFIRQRQASSTYDCTARLGELQIPTVIMHGRKDKIIAYALAEETHAGIPGSKLITFAGGHLFIVWGERQRFLDAIVEFLGA